MIQEDPNKHLPHKDETSTQEDSASDFQPLIKSSFNYVLPSNLCEDLKKKSEYIAIVCAFSIWISKLMQIILGKRKSLTNIKKAAKEKRNKYKGKISHTSETPEEE